MNLTEIPLDDTKTFKLLSEGKTLGIFQLESPGMVGLLRQVRPRSVEDLSVILALYRPGPMDSGGMQEYVRRRREAQG